jgi:hypothetical protein
MGSNVPLPKDWRARIQRHWIVLANLLLLLGGCVTNGDFGRVRPELVDDEIHDWVGRDAVAAVGGTPSEFPLTDDERRLRDLAFPLIEPPYDRNRFDSVWREYGLGRTPTAARLPFNRAAYSVRLSETYRRSEASAYAQIVTDSRNDVERIEPFFAVADRVTDMDARRAKSIAYVAHLSGGEYANAANRNLENAAIIGWVCRSLHDRGASYRFALEHLVIAAPSISAVEVERSLNLLYSRIGIHCRPAAGGHVVAKG